MSKNFIFSKTFWFNVLTAVATATEVMPLDPTVTALIVAAVNVGLRFVTDKSLTVMPKE